MTQHGISCGLLLPSELASKPHVQRSTVVTLVANNGANPEVGECLANIVEAPTRQSDVMRVVLGTRDDTRLVVGI